MKAHAQGFTLVEVMVALFILALTFMGVIASATHVSRAINRLEEKTMALWVVQNAIAEMQLGLPQINPIVMGNKEWYWKTDSVSEGKYQRVTLSVATDKHGDSVVEKVFYAAQ